MHNKVLLICAIVFFMACGACSGENEHEEEISNISGNDTTGEESTNDDNNTSDNMITTDKINITIGDNVLTATLVDNSSTEALKEALSEAPITIDMRDYGNMEKVGAFGRDFPTNDESITTEAGDLILYQGSAFVIYYASNTWSFTRLGKIDDITASELKEVLGDGDVTVTLSLAE